MWQSVRYGLPENGVVVETKVDDGNGCRLVQKVKRKNDLWFLPDDSMYVYYTPTHWRY